MSTDPAHIFLVEGNAGDARLLRELLEEAGSGRFTLTHVDRLDVGLRCLNKAAVDIILLDLSLPDSQGTETLSTMYAAADGIPIVVMTGVEDEELGLQLIQTGAQDYLVKGQVTAPLLIRALRYAVERQRLERDLREKRGFLQSVLNSMAEGVVMADETGTFKVWNPAAERILGRDPAQIRIDRWSEHYAVFLPDRVTPYPTQDLPLAKAIRGQPVTNAYMFLSPPGQPEGLWLSVSARPLLDENRRPKGGVAVFRDITAAKHTDEALRASQERYRLLVTKANDIIYRTDAMGRFTFVNPIAMRIMKYSEQELLGRRFIELIHPEHQKAAERFYGRQFVRQQLSTYYEFPAVAKDDREVWIGQNVQVLLEENKVVGFQAVARDITERKRAEEALLESEGRLRSIVQSTSDAIILMDTEGNVAFWNNGAEKAFGYTAEEMLGWPVARIIPERFREAHQRGVTRVAAAGGLTVHATMFELVGLRKDGTEFPLEFSLAAWTAKSKLFITGILRNISERAQAETALRESERRYRQLIESLPAAVYTCDAQGYITLYNQAAVALWGREPVLGKDVWCGSWKIYEPDGTTVPLDHCPMAVAMREGRPIRDTEIVIERPDGTRRSVLPHPDPICDDSGTVIGSVNMLVDITDRKQAEEERQKLARERLLLLESTGDGIYGVDPDGCCTFINKAGAGMLGYEPNELMGKNMHLLIHHSLPDGVVYPRERCRIYKTLTSGKGSKVDSEVYWRKDGTAFPIEYSSFPIIEHEHITGAVVIFLDVTQRKRAEQQLTFSHDQLRKLTARLESVREEERILIAREIHDELGQALTGVKLELSLLHDQVSETDPTQLNRLESISTLVDSTIQSVRRIATELRPVVLDQLGLIPAIEWQAHEFQSRTGIRCTLDIYMRSVTLSHAGSTAMFRIFQEILTNVARHAQASTVNITLQEQAGSLVLEVRDNGRGVTDAELSDPQSLGLVGMRERALLMGGTALFVGNPGTGTTVEVRIPLDQSQPT